TSKGGPPQTDYLKPDLAERNALYDPEWRFRLRSSYGEPAANAFRDAESGDPRILGRLLIRSPGAGEVDARRVPFRLGEPIEVAGGFTVTVSEATASFRLDPSKKEEVRDPRPLV